MLGGLSVSGFGLGASYVWRGFRTWSSNPKLMAWGLVPGAATFLFVVGVFIAVSYNVGDAASWVIDRVASGATGSFAAVLSVLVAIALVAGALLAAVYTFTALTLLVGQPFFERISRMVDDELGPPDAPAENGWWRASLHGLADSAKLLSLTAVVAIGLFFVSLVPVAGTVTAFVVGAGFGGWLLSLELTAYPLSRRGHTALRHRRHQLATQRSVSAGFGVTVFLLFLIPFGAVLAMPSAIAGATLLARRLLGGSEATRTP
jgi:CysZ protein